MKHLHEVYRYATREWLQDEHRRLVTKMFEENPPSLSTEDDLRLGCTRLALDLLETQTPHGAALTVAVLRAEMTDG